MVYGETQRSDSVAHSFRRENINNITLDNPDPKDQITKLLEVVSEANTETELEQLLLEGGLTEMESEIVIRYGLKGEKLSTIINDLADEIPNKRKDVIKGEVYYARDKAVALLKKLALDKIDNGERIQ
jgi:phosphoenolpyruvate carboxylase